MEGITANNFVTITSRATPLTPDISGQSIRVIDGSVSDSYSNGYAMYPRLSNSIFPLTQPYALQSSSVVIALGTQGLPVNPVLTSTDGILCGGNGATGETLSYDGFFAVGGYANYGNAFGGGGGGGGAAGEINLQTSTISSQGNNAVNVSRKKSYNILITRWVWKFKRNFYIRRQ